MVVILQGRNRKRIYMDGYLQQNLDRAKHLLDKDWDCLFIIDGPERSGKSVLAQQIAAYLDPTFDISRIAFTGKEFKDAIHNAKQHQAVVFDEGMSALFSRRTMSEGNVKLVQYLAEVGQKNLFLIIVLPSFFVLDQYAAVHRSSALLHVYCSANLDRGYFAFYNRQHKQDLWLSGKSGMNYQMVTADFRGRFLDGYVVDEEEYRGKKADTLKDHTKEKENNLTERNKKIVKMAREGKTIFQIKKVVGIKNTRIREIIREAEEENE